MNVIESGASAAIGGLVVALIDSIFFRRFSRLADKVDALEKERIAKLESILERHIEADVSQRLLTEVRTLIGAVNKLGDAVTRYGERTAEQEAHLCAHDNTLESIDRVIQNHLNNHHRRR